MRQICRTAAATLILASATTAAGACEPITLTSDGSQRSVHHVDVPPEGPSPGDLRYGSRSLQDENGEPAGHAQWRVTSLPNLDGDAMLIEGVHVLPDGKIFSSNHLAPKSAISDTSQTSSPGGQGAIVGGSGAYAAARGTIDVEINGQKFTYKFDMRCD